MSFVVIDGGFKLTPLIDGWNQQHSSKPSKSYLKILNNWSRAFARTESDLLCDRFWLFATESEDHAKVSLANPTSTLITNVNSTTYTALRGFTGNGSNMYLDTNYNPNTGGVYFTQNSATLGVYSRTAAAAADLVEIGHSDATNKTFIITRGVGNVTYFPMNMSIGTASPSVSNSTSTGLFQTSRTASNLSTLYKNGASLGTSATVSNGLVNNNIYICTDNLNGVASLFSTKQISMAFIGGGGIDASKFYDAFQTLATQLGFNV